MVWAEACDPKGESLMPAEAVIDISNDELPAVKSFLERSPETSLFLLSNIRAFGTRLSESMYSGNLKGLKEGSDFAAVFCVTRGGSLLAQAPGRPDLAGEIVRACRIEKIPIRGVLGEWNVSRAIWDVLCARGSVKETVASKEVMYRLAIDEARLGSTTSPLVVRMMGPDDHDQWEQLSADFLKEVGLPTLGERDQRMASFVRSSGRGHWWGGFEGERLVSMIGIIALHETTAQIGGVFTPTDMRRRGYSRAVLARLLQDARQIHGLDRIFLFTGEENVAARMLYESIGFTRFGHFGLFFGEPLA
jgi:predicted GNAT family acetyltransferase